MTQAWHQHQMRVQYKDTDQMGVVHHGNYITWFEVARTEWMRHFDMSYHAIEEQGLLLPVLDVNAAYKSSARFDDLVVLFTRIEQYSPIRLVFQYEVRRITEEDGITNGLESATVEEPYGELLTTGATTHMWVNQAWKPVKLRKTHPELYEKIQRIAD
ncbi:acyl-CoA thioesterase [Oceanobacillus jeddahense]|uniref:Acyl-CoA thioesterase n=1 Tax=Oceanobacillus jeddahense TaxID=1462527 RepID=A0ABY5JXD0_9BACI|nr:thioesterase family protein [Oceanobacillus jeddahense]UUI05053.1 acyl-CoA thioesterase [Oceanobacillus jeddahense]